MRTTRLSLWVLLPAVCATIAWAHLDGPPPGHTGAPGEGTCADAGCHDSYPVNSGPGAIRIDPWNFLAPDSLLFDVRIEGSQGVRWGFQGVVLETTSIDVFELVRSDSARTRLWVVHDSLEYVTHSAVGAIPIAPDSLPSWQFLAVHKYRLVADAPCPYIFVSAVVADGDGTPAGDYVYTNWDLFWEHLCMCPTGWYIMGDLNESWSVTSADIIELINIVFKGSTMELPCALADVNCSHAINSADIIFMVNHVFKGAIGPCDGCYSLLNLEC